MIIVPPARSATNTKEVLNRLCSLVGQLLRCPFEGTACQKEGVSLMHRNPLVEGITSCNTLSYLAGDGAPRTAATAA